MRYVVEVEYRLIRRLTVHAANPELAKKKAVAIVNTWQGAIDPTPISVHEEIRAEK